MASAAAATSSSVCHVRSAVAQPGVSKDRSPQSLRSQAAHLPMAAGGLVRSSAIFAGKANAATCSAPDVDTSLKRGQSTATNSNLQAPSRSSSSSSSRGRRRRIIVKASLNRSEEHKEMTPQLILRANAAALTAATAGLVVGAAPAHAEGVHIEDLQAAVDEVIDISKQVADGAGVAYEVAKTVFERVVEALKPAVDVAAPVVQQATDATIKAATPVAESLAEEAQKALEQAGIDTQPALQAAKTAVTVAGEATEQVTEAVKAAKPLAESTLETVLASDPLVLVIGAGALLLLYLLAPSIAGTVVSATRGYTGDVSAAQALDLLSTQGYVLIDLRTEKDKGKSGLPSLPKNARKKATAVSCEELQDKKLRGQLRNPRSVEADVAAIKIASLKQVGKGSKIVLLDESCDIAKQVARSLSALGFRNVYVIEGGFSGSTGWLQSRLSSEPYYFGEPMFLSPSRILSGTRQILKPSTSNGRSNAAGTAARQVNAEVLQRSRLSLPGGRE